MTLELGCPSCRQHFESLENLNKHIRKTGHNENNLVRNVDVLQWMGVKIDYEGIMKLSLKVFKSISSVA